MSTKLKKKGIPIADPYVPKNTWFVRVKCTGLPQEAKEDVEQVLTDNIGDIISQTVVQSVKLEPRCRATIMLRCKNRKHANFIIRKIRFSKKSVKMFAYFHKESREVAEDGRDKILQEMEDISALALHNHQVKLDEVNRFVTMNLVNIIPSKHTRTMQFRQVHEQKSAQLTEQMYEYKKYCAVLKCKARMANSIAETNDIVHLLEVETQKLNSALPIYAKKSEIIEMTLDNKAFVLLGETGSGKSTQTPQYLCQTDLCERGLIACIQPRQVAAVSLAQQVAKEMKSHVGGVVGYRAGFQVRQTAATKVMYLTNHAILKECIKDPLLTKYSCVIVDEAHERSIYCDLLLGMIKSAMQSRPDLKVIIMSATIDPALFVCYFQNCPVMQVSGRAFPVDIIYKPEHSEYDDTNYLQEAVEKALDVHKKEDAGDILVFLTTPVETERAVDMFTNRVKDKQVQCFSLHGRLQSQEQQKVFEVTCPGRRKVVFATNCAETSITLPGIKYVIDTGKANEMKFDSKKGINTLNVQWISKSSADQRKGRAGRTSSGKCFRLYSQSDYDKMQAGTTPDLLKSHLGMAFLSLMDMGISDPLQFDYVEAPERETMQQSMKELHELEALGDTGLSDLGRQLAKLSLDPKYGKLLLEAVKEDMGFDVMVIIALLTVGANIFFRMGTNEEKERADRLKTRFCHAKGDIFTMYNVYKSWYENPEKTKSAWCRENSINGKSMRMCRDVVNDLRTTFKKDLNISINFDFCRADDFEMRLSRLLLRSFSKKVSRFTGHSRVGYYVPTLGSPVVLHPSATLSMLNLEPEWVFYTGILATNRQYLLNATSIDEQLLVAEIGSDRIAAISLDMQERHCILETHEVCKAGPAILKKVIGPKGSNVNRLKMELQEEYFENMLHVLDIAVSSGCVNLTCEHALCEDPLVFLQSQVQNIKQEFREETIADKLHQNTDIRYILEQGAVLQSLLLPGDFRAVVIHECPPYVSDDEILDLFRKYGTIASVQQFKKHKQKKYNSWGKIVYKNERDAKDVMQTYNSKKDDQLNFFKIEAENTEVQQNSGSQSVTRLRVKWLKRPCTGIAFLKFQQRQEAVNAADILCNAAHSSSGMKFMLSRKNPTDVAVRNVPKHAMKEDLVAKVYSAWPPGDYIPNFDVAVIREKAMPVSGEHQSRLKDILTANIRRSSQEAKFHVVLWKPTDKAIEWTGFIETSDFATAEKICDSCQGMAIGDLPVSLQYELSTRFRLNFMFAKLRRHFDETVKYVYRTQTGVLLKVDKDRQGHEVLFLEASDPVTFQEVTKICQELLYGKFHKAHHEFDMAVLQSPNGQKFLSGVKAKTSCILTTDCRNHGIHIYGSKAKQLQATAAIEEYLNNNKDRIKREVELTGEKKPAGLMKFLLIKYGINLEKLLVSAELDSIELILRRHTLVMIGREDAVSKATEEISEAAEEVSKQPNMAVLGDECPVCLCPIMGKIYHMEGCGHAYCYECIRQMFHSAATNKELPITCAKDGCEELAYIVDIRNVMRKSDKFDQLIDAAVDKFVVDNRERYNYCLTPDCRMIYKSAGKARTFSCPHCFIEICRTCHNKVHKGLSCDYVKDTAKEDLEGITEWLKADEKNRCLCPKCNILVEKISGCNHMHCRLCKTHFCMICKKTFPTSSQTYGHMRSTHGDIYNPDHEMYNFDFEDIQ